MRRRKNYDPNFRARVALEAAKGNRTLSELSGEYKVHANLIVKWKKEMLQKLPSLFQKADRHEIEEAMEKNDELYKEIGKLKMELDYYCDFVKSQTDKRGVKIKKELVQD